jgi:hypothetical protein
MKDPIYALFACPDIVCPFGWNEFGAGLAVGWLIASAIFLIGLMIKEKP